MGENGGYYWRLGEKGNTCSLDNVEARAEVSQWASRGVRCVKGKQGLKIIPDFWHKKFNAYW